MTGSALAQFPEVKALLALGWSGLYPRPEGHDAVCVRRQLIFFSLGPKANDLGGSGHKRSLVIIKRAGAHYFDVEAVDAQIAARRDRTELEILHKFAFITQRTMAPGKGILSRNSAQED